MREEIPYRRLAAELATVLLGFGEEEFSPSELLGTLLSCPAWSGYLAGFESERGQPAAVGRFLNEAGLVKASHHRSRGSLYSRPAALLALRGMLDQPEAPSSVSPGGESPVPATPEAVASGLQRERPGQTVPSQDRKRPDPGRTRVERRGANPLSHLPETPKRRSGEREPSEDGDGRPAPVIGWRRRATDLTRTPRRSTSSAAEAAGAAAATEPAYAAPVPGMLPPPVWVGGGTTLPAGGFPAGLTPYGGWPEFGPPEAGEEAGLPLDFYWTQIRRHLYKILLAAALITLAVGFYTLRTPKLYESAVTLRVDFSSPAIVADASSNPAFDPTTIIQTEVMDAAQRSVIQDAIAAAHLDLDPSLRAEAGLDPGTIPTVANPDAFNDALVDLIGHYTRVVVPDNTRNIQILFRSRSPESSAKVANALAAALIAHEFQTRQQEQNDSLKFMTEQFKDVRARMEGEQDALTAYQHRNNLLNPDGQGSLEDATLGTLNSSYLAAQAQLTRLQAEKNILATGQPTDTLLASDDGQILRPSYESWRAAQSKFLQVKATRGSANPEYIAAQQNLSAAHEQLQAAMASVRNQIDAQYRRAQDQLHLVEQQLNGARTQAQAFNDKAIDYNTQKRDLEADQKLYDSLLAQIKQQQLTATIGGSNLRITNAAVPDAAPVYPNVPENTALALLFSLFAGCGLAILAGYLDRSFTSPEQVESVLHIPLLGALPALEDRSDPIELATQPPAGVSTGTGGEGRSSFAEAILMLRTSVLYAAPSVRTLSIASAQPLEGKSIVLANLAIAMALHGAKVLLVDGDIRRPSQHRIFNLPNQTGLTSLLRQTAPLEECFRPTAVERLYLMPAGPAVPNPSELVAMMLAQAVTPLASEFDYVLVDSPPLLGFADAVSIATAVEATVLVARAGKTQRELVRAALQPLKRVRARVVGLVLNEVSRKLNPYFSYYEDKYYDREDSRVEEPQ